jgi:hypothetical protein
MKIMKARISTVIEELARAERRKALSATISLNFFIGRE